MKPTTVVKPVTPSSLKPGQKWTPIEGVAASGVLDRSPLKGSARTKTLNSAADILSRGIDPKSPSGSETGLVVGYVQSGKTLSFTTVIGLARDNGFPLVIVIAGTKSPLLTQSTERLDKDLNISASGGSWRKLTNPRDENKQTIATIIGD